MSVISLFAESTDLGKRIQACTVRIIVGEACWTGIVIGSTNGRSLILTVAHGFKHSRGSMNPETIEADTTVKFFSDKNNYTCKILRYRQDADLALLSVDRSSESTLQFPPSYDNLLLESELLGSRGHPVNGRNWQFSETKVIFPRIVNNSPPLMILCRKDLLYFEHCCNNMSVGYSGAPLVNVKGHLVGMNSGEAGRATFRVLGSAAFESAYANHVNHVRNLEQPALEPITLNLGAVRLHSSDVQQIAVPVSSIKYAIHAEFLEKILRIGLIENTVLEDFYLSNDFVGNVT